MRIWKSLSIVLVLGFSMPLLVASHGYAQRRWCNNSGAMRERLEAAIATRDWSIIEEAIDRCGESVIAETIDAIQANSDRLGSGDLEALRDMGAGGEQIVRVLTTALRENGSTLLRLGVTTALQQLSEQSDYILSDSAESLRFENSELSHRAADVIGVMEGVLPNLIAGLGSDGQRDRAGANLQRLGPRAQAAALALMATLLKQSTATDCSSAGFAPEFAPGFAAEDPCAYADDPWRGYSRAIAPGNANAPKHSKRDRILSRHCGDRNPTLTPNYRVEQPYGTLNPPLPATSSVGSPSAVRIFERTDSTTGLAHLKVCKFVVGTLVMQSLVGKG